MHSDWPVPERTVLTKKEHQLPRDVIFKASLMTVDSTRRPDPLYRIKHQLMNI
jgi:hypothetical protein